MHEQPSEDKGERMRKKAFYTIAIVAIIAIVTGLVLSLEAISSGILGGGILLLVYSVMRHWGILNKYLADIKNPHETLLDSVLWGVKLNGCAVSKQEIEEILKIESAH